MKRNQSDINEAAFQDSLNCCGTILIIGSLPIVALVAVLYRLIVGG
jgi:hypothetical protein